MTLAESDDFTARLVALGELFNAELSPVKQALYFEALRDLPLALVVKALNQAVRTQVFMPKPAELRTLAVGDDECAVEGAWLEYKRLARQIGGYHSVEVEATLALALEAVFGTWEQACWVDLSPEMWVAKRREFGRVYRVMRQRGASGLRCLVGCIDRDNALRGFAAEGHALGEGDRPALSGETA